MPRRMPMWIAALTVLLLTLVLLAAVTVAGTEYAVHLPFVAKPRPPQHLDITLEFSEVFSRWGGTRLIAVAFRSLAAIDPQGRALYKLRFGTPAANQLQGSGWYENDTWPDVGTVQWAGTSAKRATLQLTVPGETEGLLLDIIGVQDGMWMDVSIGGEATAKLRVDEYWHCGYVPIGAGVVDPAPDAEPLWSEGRYFPAFPPTDRLYSIRMRAPLPDWEHGAIRESWRISQSHQVMMDLTLVGMQGVINRTGPRVYLDWYEPAHVGTLQDTSGFWPPLLDQHATVVDMELDGLSAVHFLMRRFSPRFAGAVVYDPQVPDTINLATMLAGLEDRIMLAPEQLTLPGMEHWLDEMDLRFTSALNPMSLPTLAAHPCATDLTQLAQQQAWDATVDAQTSIYQWVYDNLWSQLDHRIIGLISPGPPTSRQMVEGIYWPMGLASRDYMVALKLPALYLHPKEGQQATLLDRFLDDAPSPIPVTGVFSGWEEGTTEVASKHGDWIAAISWPGPCLTVRSLSALGGVRPAIARYQATLDDDRLWAALGDGPLACVFSTDGDAIFWQMGRGSHGEFGWEFVQGQRFGWTMNPVLSELAPVVWNDFVQNRTEVSFLCGTAGVGYMYPSCMDEGQLASYLDRAGHYLDQTGIRSLYVYTVRGSWSAELSRRYYEGLQDHGLLGLILGGNELRHNHLVYYGDPAPAVWKSYGMTPDNMTQTADDLLDRHHGEIDLDLDTYHHEGQTVTDADAEGGLAAWFSRSILSDCCNVASGPESGTVQGPGSYAAAFRLKVPENTASGNLARIAVRAPGVGVLAERFLQPTDFAQAGQYESFELTYPLDQFTAGVQAELDYYGGWEGGPDVDLYADEIRVVPEGEEALPVFAAVQLMWAEGMVDLPRNFRARLESGGGVVLHPDEFLAALNPQFMIEWATPILGVGHPALVQAQTLLGQQRFLDSLYTVREALKEARQ